MTDFLEIQKAELLHETVQEVVLLEPQGDEQVLEIPTEHLLLELSPDDVMLEPAEKLVLLEAGIQGPPGPRGLRGERGPVGDAGGAFLVARRLGEIAGDTQAQAEAQQNLGLGVADPLAYYILAKS